MISKDFDDVLKPRDAILIEVKQTVPGMSAVIFANWSSSRIVWRHHSRTRRSAGVVIANFWVHADTTNPDPEQVVWRVRRTISSGRRLERGFTNQSQEKEVYMKKLILISTFALCTASATYGQTQMLREEPARSPLNVEISCKDRVEGRSAKSGDAYEVGRLELESKLVRELGAYHQRQGGGDKQPPRDSGEKRPPREPGDKQPPRDGAPSRERGRPKN